MEIVYMDTVKELRRAIQENELKTKKQSLQNITSSLGQEDLAILLDAVLKACPDTWFPRGKWATIQAIQERNHYAR